MNEDIKKLYYEADTRKHQQAVSKWMGKAINNILGRMLSHDESKFTDEEAPYYADPVYQLNTQEVAYGSDEYKTLTKQMGLGWEHHKSVNDHHPEHFGPDPFKKMDLFQLLEMACDWIAASERRGNDPTIPIARMMADFGLEEQLAFCLKRTIDALEGGTHE